MKEEKCNLPNHHSLRGKLKVTLLNFVSLNEEVIKGPTQIIP